MFDIDTKQFKIILDRLTPKEYKTAFRKSIREALNILRKKAIANLKGVTTKIDKKDQYNNTLRKAIQLKVYPEDLEGIVHSMGNFKLKWFQNGTVDRYAKKYRGKPMKRKRFTGKIDASKFFTNAKSQTESAVFNKLNERIQQNIIKIYTGTK
mgnify:FL=1